MIKILNTPFPFNYDTRTELLINLGLGIFVAIFLIVFQPYGTQEFVSDHKAIFLAGYGIIISLIFVAFRHVLGPVLHSPSRLRRWTLGKHLLYLCGLLLLTYLVWYAYWGWYFNNSLSLSGWFRFIALSFSITVFPLAAMITAAYIYLLRHKTKSVDAQLHDRTQANNEKSLFLQSDEGTESLHMDSDQLLYIRAARNYIEVYFTARDGIVQSLLRCSLKNVAAQVPEGVLVQCHRSYLVNPQRVDRVLKSPRRILLLFDDKIPTVPVSRSRRKTLESITEALDPLVPNPSS